jgi:hypothetical protein
MRIPALGLRVHTQWQEDVKINRVDIFKKIPPLLGVE